MTSGGFDLECATRVVGDAGRYRARLSAEWEIWGPNGGYLAAFALRAAGELAQIRRPASFYCHFLRSPTFDEVQLDVNVLRRGRRAESFAVAMTQDGDPVLHALVRTAQWAPGYEYALPDVPLVPRPQELLSDEQRRPGRRRFAFWENVERRPIDQGSGGEPPEPRLREWARFRPTPSFADPFVEAARALILLDTYGFPAAHRRFDDWKYIAPNLDTSAWFHDPGPHGEWLLVDHECVAARDGLIGVSGRVWNAQGGLVATGSAQLCCVANER